MILEHYSDEPWEYAPMSYAQRRYDQDGNGKPNGLWVSVKGEDDWPSWCHGEGYRTERLAICQRVILKPEANVLTITTVAEIVAFHDKYGVAWEIGGDFSLGRIDWRRVATDYDGVIIAPYLWECRLAFNNPHLKKISDWYYGWDCASGCIWNGDAIAAFELAEQEEEA